MKAADADLHAGGEEWVGDIDGARKLIRLHADEADQGTAAGLVDLADDAVRAYPPVRLVVRVQTDFRIRPKDLAALCIFCEAIETGQRIGRDGGAEPLDRIAVIVVVGRLDDDEMEESGPGDCLRFLDHGPYLRPVARCHRIKPGLPSWSVPDQYPYTSTDERQH